MIQTLNAEDCDERPHRFCEALRCHRLGVPLETTALGGFVRVSNRIGKIVSQEELAEAIGISRTWYCVIEAGRFRPSMDLVRRICDALMLDEAKRLDLVDLAFPGFAAMAHQVVALYRDAYRGNLRRTPISFET